LLEEKDVEIDEMDQALEAKKIDACDERDREIRELKQRVDELTDENYRLKEILDAVPEKYRGEYEVDDYEFIPSFKTSSRGKAGARLENRRPSRNRLVLQVQDRRVENSVRRGRQVESQVRGHDSEKE
jgi:hypothetical protein